VKLGPARANAETAAVMKKSLLVCRRNLCEAIIVKSTEQLEYDLGDIATWRAALVAQAGHSYPMGWLKLEV